jgi:transposase InsO family protein
MVNDHIEDGVTLKEIKEKYHIDLAKLKYAIALFRKHGEGVFLQRERIKYDREYKLQAIHRYLQGHESYYEIGVDLGIIVTMFITRFGRLYPSPIIDFHSREILSYDLSETPDYGQIRRMLNNLNNKHGRSINGSVLQSDQGYLYQLGVYQRLLKSMGMIQSMSRKGNCLDNSPTENFFGRMKTEMFYGKEDRFTSMQHLKEAIISYIDYYNKERIVNKLMTSPIKYRNKVMAALG